MALVPLLSPLCLAGEGAVGRGRVGRGVEMNLGSRLDVCEHGTRPACKLLGMLFLFFFFLNVLTF